MTQKQQGLTEAQIQNLLANKQEYIKQFCEMSLMDFIEFSWPQMEPETPLIKGWAIEAICDHLEAVTSGQIKRLAINVPPGLLKPCSVNELVATQTGPVRLGDIKIGDKVLTHTGRYRKVTAVHEQGTLDCVKITTWCGRETIAAPDHPFLTTEGWVNAGDIKNHILAVPLPQEDPGIPISRAESRLLGYLVGDGSTKYAPGFTSCDIDMLDDFEACAAELGFNTRRFLRGSKTYYVSLTANGTSKVTDWLKHHNLRGKDSYTKRVPDAVKQSNRQGALDFLGAYWACDGCVAIRHRGKKTSHFAFVSTVSKGLAHDTLDLMQRVGIPCRVRRKEVNLKTKRQGDTYVSYDVIGTTQDVVAQVRTLDMSIRKNATIANVQRRLFPQTLTPDQATTVEPVGKHECRCLTVDVDHSFTVAGLAVKNSVSTNVMWPAWEWGPKNRPATRYISAGYDQNLSVRDMLRCRDLIKSEWYQKNWPIEFKEDQDLKQHYANTRTGWRYAASVRAALTGYRADRIIIDDPHSATSADSDIEREQSLRWFSETLPTRLNNQSDSAIVLIMQRLHARDISGLVIEELGDEWTHLCLPMEFEKAHRSYTVVKPRKPKNAQPQHMRRIKTDADALPIYLETEDKADPLLYSQDPRTEEDELLFPARFPKKAVEDLKRVFRAGGGDYAVASQLQQRPIPRGGGMFQREHFNIIEAHELRHHQVQQRVRGWDLAASTKKRAKFTASVKIFKTSTGQLIIAHAHHAKLTPSAVKTTLKNTATSDTSNTKQSIPQDPGQAGVAQRQDFAALLDGFDVKFSPESGDKVTRSTPFAAQVEAGNVYLLKAAWNDAFLNELCQFPMGQYSDFADAAARAHQELISHTKHRLALLPGMIIEG